jgi:glycosyltransferase involved in cell wall biosynthesis
VTSSSIAAPRDGCRCAEADVTVIIPCHNEETTIASVIAGFRAALPLSRVIVADNLCTDDTAKRAVEAGAEVIPVPIPGKGRAVRRLFELCRSEVVIMVDGDATYDPAPAAQLVHHVVCDGYDLVNVRRLDDEDDAGAYRGGHRIGNKLLTGLQRRLTGIQLADILTGYKAMSRRFVTSLPIRSRRFQLEAEIAAHAAAMDFAYREVAAPYRSRLEGSESKLSTYRDGVSILRMLLRLYRDIYPFRAFAFLSLPWFAVSIGLVVRPVRDYLRTGAVATYPSLIAGMATFVVSMLLLTSGWLLERTRSLRRDTLLVAANDLERQIALLNHNQARTTLGADGPAGRDPAR